MPPTLTGIPLAASFEWIFFLLFFGAFVVLIVAVQRFEKKRTADLKVLAGRLGMDFFETGIELESEIFYDFPLFQRGHSRKTRNVFREAKGNTETAVFDLRATH